MKGERWGKRKVLNGINEMENLKKMCLFVLGKMGRKEAGNHSWNLTIKVLLHFRKHDGREIESSSETQAPKINASKCKI